MSIFKSIRKLTCGVRIFMETDTETGESKDVGYDVSSLGAISFSYKKAKGGGWAQVVKDGVPVNEVIGANETGVLIKHTVESLNADYTGTGKHTERIGFWSYTDLQAKETYPTFEIQVGQFEILCDIINRK